MIEILFNETLFLEKKEICKRLDWNFNQLTSYHYFEILIHQGIFSNSGGSSIEDTEAKTISTHPITPTSALAVYPLNSRKALEGRSSSLLRQNSSSSFYGRTTLTCLI